MSYRIESSKWANFLSSLADIQKKHQPETAAQTEGRVNLAENVWLLETRTNLLLSSSLIDLASKSELDCQCIFFARNPMVIEAVAASKQSAGSQ